MCKQWPRSDCAHAQSDLGLHCPLTESMTTMERMGEQRSIQSVRDAQAGLGTDCSHMAVFLLYT